MRFLSIFFILTLLTSFLAGCVSIHSSGFSNVSKTSGTPVQVESSGVGILHLTAPDIKALEQEALKKLKAQGADKNICIRLQSRNFIPGILPIVQFYSVTATGEKEEKK